jgi:hypothetical protein
MLKPGYSKYDNAHTGTISQDTTLTQRLEFLLLMSSILSHAISFMLDSCLDFSSTLKMEAKCSCETSADSL